MFRWIIDGKYVGDIVLTPYGLEIIESCLSCKMRAEHILCDLAPDALQAFESIKYANAYPKGAVLFVEGQSPRGIFVLCKGRVRMSLCSDGRQDSDPANLRARRSSGPERHHERQTLRVDR